MRLALTNEPRRAESINLLYRLDAMGWSEHPATARRWRSGSSRAPQTVKISRQWARDQSEQRLAVRMK